MTPPRRSPVIPPAPARLPPAGTWKTAPDTAAPGFPPPPGCAYVQDLGPREWIILPRPAAPGDGPLLRDGRDAPDGTPGIRVAGHGALPGPAAIHCRNGRAVLWTAPGSITPGLSGTLSGLLNSAAARLSAPRSRPATVRIRLASCETLGPLNPAALFYSGPDAAIAVCDRHVIPEGTRRRAQSLMSAAGVLLTAHLRRLRQDPS